MNDVASLPNEECFEISEQDQFDLSQMFRAQQGIADLILYCGEETFLPEMKSENMAAILYCNAVFGAKILEKAEPKKRSAKAA